MFAFCPPRSRRPYAPSSFVIIASIFACFAARNWRAFHLAAAAASAEIPCPHLHADRFRLEIRISRVEKRPLTSNPRERIRLDEQPPGPSESALKFKVSTTRRRRQFANVQLIERVCFSFALPLSRRLIAKSLYRFYRFGRQTA